MNSDYITGITFGRIDLMQTPKVITDKVERQPDDNLFTAGKVSTLGGRMEERTFRSWFFCPRVPELFFRNSGRRLEHRNTGTLEPLELQHWNTGPLDHWYIGTLGQWNTGLLSSLLHVGDVNEFPKDNNNERMK